jgi:protein SCO1
VKKNKRWFLLLLIAFPSVFWLLLETSTVNSKKLPIYGPRQVSASGDSLYHRVGDVFYKDGLARKLDIPDYPLFVVGFAAEKYRKDGYRLSGIWEYVNYKKSKIAHIPVILVTEEAGSDAEKQLSRLAEAGNVHFYNWPRQGFDSLRQSFFVGKPYYIDYSFLVLIDADRRVRGYYDARYAAEVKRLTEEYQHLRLKEEKKRLLRENEIETQS